MVLIADGQAGRWAPSIQLGGRPPLSSSATNAGAGNMFTVKGKVPSDTAQEMTLEDIKVTIEDHVHAAKCAIEAGFDCVEIVRVTSTLSHLSISTPWPSDSADADD